MLIYCFYSTCCSRFILFHYGSLFLYQQKFVLVLSMNDNLVLSTSFRYYRISNIYGPFDTELPTTLDNCTYNYPTQITKPLYSFSQIKKRPKPYITRFSRTSFLKNGERDLNPQYTHHVQQFSRSLDGS